MLILNRRGEYAKDNNVRLVAFDDARKPLVLINRDTKTSLILLTKPSTARMTRQISTQLKTGLTVQPQ